MKIDDIEDRGDGEFWVIFDDGQSAQVAAGWWNGCTNCGAYKDEIEEVEREYNTRQACRYALDHLVDNYLCKECYDEENKTFEME